MTELSRRAFVTGLSAVALGMSVGCGRPSIQLPLLGQQPARVPRIGVLSDSPRESHAMPPAGVSPAIDALLEGLRDYGYVPDQSIVIEWRGTNGGRDRLSALAEELIQLPVDIILATSFGPARAANERTSTIPIVVAAMNDPVAAGLVGSLARPGGNLTGQSMVAPLLSAKRVQLLKEAVPHATRFAVLADPDGATVELDWQETQLAGQTLGVQVQRFDVAGLERLDSAFEAAREDGAQAVVVLASAPFAREPRRIVSLATSSGLPAMYEGRTFTDVGGLMSYGANRESLMRRSAYFVDRILKGTKPTDLPVEQPMRFELVVTLRTARELGITFPHEVALQITEVIE